MLQSMGLQRLGHDLVTKKQQETASCPLIFFSLIFQSSRIGSCQYAVFFLIEVSLIYNVLAEKAMAPHSSTLAWETPWTEEPGRLQSMGSRRVGHD